MKEWSRRALAVGSFLWIHPGFADLKEKPVSVSYTNVLQCFPELKNETQSLKVDLNLLKEEMDRRFITSQSLLRYRQVILKDEKSGQLKRLKLAAKPGKKSQFSYVLSVEKLDSKKVGTPLEMPSSHRLNPAQKDLDLYFLNQEVLEDERSYFDTKLYGVTLSFKRQFQNVIELELKDPRRQKRLFCEDKNDLGIVCTCLNNK